MKTYTVLMPEKLKAEAALVAVVDSLLRGFELAINASTAYKWRNLNIGYPPGPRWIDTNCEAAIGALTAEMSRIGVWVEVQFISTDYIIR